MLQKTHYLSFPKTLLLTIGLCASTLVLANESETTLSKSDNITNSGTLSEEVLNKQNTKSSLNNPNAALVAMAFKFNLLMAPQITILKL